MNKTAKPHRVHREREKLTDTRVLHSALLQGFGVLTSTCSQEELGVDQFVKILKEENMGSSNYSM